jgi:hypothetical protein
MRECRHPRPRTSVPGCNSVATALLLLVFCELAPHAKYAGAQEVAGIHCAVGTGSCGNWLELGGYKTSCECSPPRRVRCPSVLLLMLG